MSENALVKMPTPEEIETEFQDLFDRKGTEDLVASRHPATSVPATLLAGSTTATVAILILFVMGALTAGSSVVAVVLAFGFQTGLRALAKRWRTDDLRALSAPPPGYSRELAERAERLRGWVNSTFPDAPVDEEDDAWFEELDQLRLALEAAQETARLEGLEPDKLLTDGDDLEARFAALDSHLGA